MSGGGAADPSGGSLVVIGSAIDVDPEQIRTLAAQAAKLSKDLGAVSARLATASGAIEATIGWSAHSGQAALTQTHMARLAVLGCTNSVDSVRAKLQQAADGYDRAEELAKAPFVLETPKLSTFGSWLLAPVPFSGGALLLGTTLAAAHDRGQKTPSATQTEYFLRKMAYTATFGWLYPDWAPWADDRVQLLTDGVAAGLEAGVAVPAGFTPNGVEVTRISRAEPLGLASTAPNPNGAGSMVEILNGVQDVYEAKEVPPGTIRLDKITTDEGTFWQVYIPGTQTQLGDIPGGLAKGDPTAWTSPLANEVPQDWLTDVQLAAGRPNAVQNGVVKALEMAGVGEDEPIMFAGHSQGGMVAMALAGDKRVQDNYTVSSVVSFGSPVAKTPVPSDVAVLNIEHEDDMVPGADGAANPISPNRVTVRRDISQSLDPDDQQVTSVAQAHNFGPYRKTAGMVDRSSAPELESWRAQAAESLVHNEHRTTQSYYFKLRRTEMPLVKRFLGGGVF